MNSSRSKRNYENLEKRIFTGVGEYGIPELAPVDYEKDCEFIPFNYASSTKNREKKGVHFFVKKKGDDEYGIKEQQSGQAA